MTSFEQEFNAATAEVERQWTEKLEAVWDRINDEEDP